MEIPGCWNSCQAGTSVPTLRAPGQLFPTHPKSHIPKDHPPLWGLQPSSNPSEVSQGAQLWGCPFPPGSWNHNFQLQLELGWNSLDFP